MVADVSTVVSFVTLVLLRLLTTPLFSELFTCLKCKIISFKDSDTCPISTLYSTLINFSKPLYLNQKVSSYSLLSRFYVQDRI